MSADGFGEMLKQKRTIIPMTLQQLAAKSGVSASHLGRIEKGDRFPSGNILRKIAKPLGFDDGELFILAGYLPAQASTESETQQNLVRLDPYVANVLASEPVAVQRTVIGILIILKSIARAKERSD